VVSERSAVDRLCVLVVDDNRDSADSMAMLLRLKGFDVATAYSGPEAIERAETLLPAVVLLDIGLPKADGYAVCRRIRENPLLTSTRVIAVTGYGREVDISLCREAGFDAHFLKPVDPLQIEQLLTGYSSK